MSDLPPSDVMQRLDRLEAESDIRRLIARYFRICDDLCPHTDLDALGSLFAHDAKWEGKGRYRNAFGGHEGRAAIVEMLASYCTPEPHFVMNAHFLSSEDIQVDGDRAVGKWLKLQCSTYRDDTSDLRSGALEIDFGRTAGKWEITHFRTTNIFSRQMDRWNDEETIFVPRSNLEGAPK